MKDVMTFEFALVLLKQGLKIRRKSWEYGQYLMKIDETNFKMFHGRDSHFTMGLSYENMMGDDWECVEWVN